MLSAETMTRGIGCHYGFERENDHRQYDRTDPVFTDGTGITRGYRSDLEKCSRRNSLTKSLGHQDIQNHRDRITRQIMIQRLKRPSHSFYSRNKKRMKKT